MNRIIEIFEHRQIFLDNKEVFKSPIDLTDEQLLIQLLYDQFYSGLTTIDKEKDYIYGIQFYRYDKNYKFISSNKWTSKYDIHIFSELCFNDIRDIFRTIGYKLRYLSYNRNFEVSKYELLLMKKALKKHKQRKDVKKNS